MGKKGAASGAKPPKKIRSSADHNYEIGNQVIKDGLDMSFYRFSATNMMLGLDPFVPTAQAKKILAARADSHQVKQPDRAPASKKASRLSRPSDASPIASSTEPSEPDSSLSANTDEGPKTEIAKIDKATDTDLDSSGGDLSSVPESSAGESSEMETPSAALIGPDGSTKSVTFADGTMSPADSPPAFDAQPFVPVSSTGVTDWSMSEDAMIVNMKEQGAGWDLIANTIQRTKAQVRKRFHELKVNQANEAANNEDVARMWNDSLAEEAVAEAAAVAPSEPDAGTVSAAGTDTEQQEQQYICVEDSSSTSTSSSEESPEDDDTSSASHLLDHLPSSSSGSSITDSEYDASDYDPFADPADPIADARERRRRERYIFNTTHGTPSSSADPFVSQGFSRRDRALLQALDDRRLARRWLEMQANFFNVTGRMVPLHLIKAKLEQNSPGDGEIGTLARGERKVANWTESVAYGADLLDPEYATERPEDALSDTDDSDEESGFSSD